MALSSCSSLSYSYSSDFCLGIGVDKDQDEFTVDTAWIIGAFFLGLILGCGIVLLLARPFLNAWRKKKQQDEEVLLGTSKQPEKDKGKKNMKEDKKAVPIMRKGSTFRASRFRRKMKSFADFKTKEQEIISKVDIDPAFSRGMVDVMLQTNSNESEVEMADQDMATIAGIESSMEEEKAVLLPRILGILLKAKVERREVPKTFYMNFVKKCDEELKNHNKMIQAEKEEKEEKLRNDPKLKQDGQLLETEMQKLQTDCNQKQAKMHRDYREKIRHGLALESGMSEAEVEQLMQNLINEMANIEEKLGLEQARQRRALEQRLAKRRQAIEFRENEEEATQNSIEKRKEFFDEALAAHLKDASKLEGQRDEIINAYANDLDELQKYYGKDYDASKLELSEHLQDQRLGSFYKLTKNQEKEKATITQMSERTSSAKEFVKLYHDLMIKHHMEQETLTDDLDQKEVQEMHKLKINVDKKQRMAMDELADKQAERLENVTNLLSSEADKIIKLHKAQLADYEAREQRQRQANMVQLQEKLKQRLQAADEAEARDQKEQEVLKQEQMATMTRVLSTNMELTDEAKERILKEHEQNMQVLSNQLLRSKLRQQKSLEIKLNQRRARLTELKKEQKAIQKSQKFSKDQGKDDQVLKLAKEIEKEEASFEEARQAAVTELRRQLAKETDEALQQHDYETGLLIGRLQVGQARRKAVLERQDATLKQLQDELDKRASSGKEMPASATSQIIQEHYNNVTYLNDQLQKRRNMQQKVIMEKLKYKRQDLEEQIETQLEKDAQKEYTEQQKRGAGYASLALMQTFLEQKHAKAMVDLESEMLAELEKNKNDLNMELEQELKRELEAQSQSFLRQITAVSKVSKEDLSEAMYATAEGRTDSRAAQKLARDLRDGASRTKSALSRDYTGSSYGEADNQNNYPLRKPSARKSSAISSTRFERPVSDDDGF